MFVYFAVLNYVKLKSTHNFIMKIPNKWELQQIAFNHLSDIDFKDFTNLYKKCTAVPYSSSVTHATLGKYNRSRLKKNPLKCI